MENVFSRETWHDVSKLALRGGASVALDRVLTFWAFLACPE